ncbi:phenylalanine--tRNA ligase subunit beta [Natranaerofaba carboxydovora]|uniref:phenylalanine--tRNA ligase subunit beta n=1 Tax=Natranaerofaba carboxydovora TaxID=2742683 RepID=UPI001F12D087|nr:phenylalanine--tRNA ligase subunit beta [Natranaerofaba carboxydovora]UMZ74044.1 Phenylalanine--tRNA ligase beta subunit [Natranaerofaba carboxydovora]
MKISYNWLKELLNIDIDPYELAGELTNGGVEVETVKPFVEDLSKENLVVGEVLDVSSHPNADNLSVVEVKAGTSEDPLHIVCGADNVAKGQKVPVALPGAVLPGGFKIKKAKLRGEKSYGMICSSEELGLLPEEGEEGIMVLDPALEAGEDLVEVMGLDDYILEFDLTPNRADCLGMMGVCYEVAALLDIPFEPPKPPVTFDKNEAENMVSVDIKDEELCNRYTAHIVKDIKIGPSPTWLKQRLRAVGIRPINNLVDITNFVMFEYGQPMHAFDYDRVSGDEIIVRRAYENEKLTTLDEKERTLDESALVIADKERAIGLAGVMGGLNTEVTPETKTMLLEAAAFDNINIRRTANRLNLRSEASLRFEKGIDPNNTLNAALRALELIEELGIGKVVSGTVDEYPVKAFPEKIKLKTENVRKLTGLKISSNEIKDVFRKLQFGIEEVGESGAEDEMLKITAPTRRQDIKIEVDLIEEVTRLYGYDNLPTTLPEGILTQGMMTAPQKIKEIIRDTMLSSGLCEVLTFTFISPEEFDSINLSNEDPLRKAIPISNPLSEEQSIMRTTMLPSFLSVLEYNQNRGEGDFHIFEIGKVFLTEELPLNTLPEEREMLACAMMGKTTEEGWLKEGEKADFFHLKGIIELLFQRLGLADEMEFLPYEHPSYHPTRAAKINLKGKEVGTIGEIHPMVASEKYELTNRVVYCELRIDELVQNANLETTYKPLPKYPAVLRDIALLVSKDVPAGEVEETIEKAGGDLIEAIRLFDLYEGEQIPEGKRSLAYSLKFRAPDRTMTDEEVENLYNTIENELKDKCGAEIRK